MSTELETRLRTDLVVARKAREKERTLVLSTILSDFRNREIDSGQELTDDGALQVVSKAIKQRRDAADQMRAAGREELALNEEAQVEILQDYLPKGLTEDEVREIIRSIRDGGVEQMGAVMGQLMPRIRGRFDGKEANRIVREELGA